MAGASYRIDDAQADSTLDEKFGGDEIATGLLPSKSLDEVCLPNCGSNIV